MILRSKHLAPIIAVAFVAGIGGTMALNVWRTTTSKVPAAYQSGEFAGKVNPADIRGSYTFGDISESFAVTVQALARAFGVEKTANPAAFQVKQLESMAATLTGGQVGTDSVRWFVALYTGVPYTPEEDTLLPAAALDVLSDRLTAEQLAELKLHAAGASGNLPAPETSPTAAAPAAAAPAAAPATTAPAATTPPTAEKPASADSTAAHTSETVVGEIRGKTTFGELTSWGVSKEAIEAALGKPMGKPGISVRDYCAENGLEFSTVKTPLQAAVDAALGTR